MELSDATEKISSDWGSIPGPSDYATPGPMLRFVYIYKFVPFHTMKATGGEEVQLHLFLNWALDGSASTSRPLYPGGGEVTALWAPKPFGHLEKRSMLYRRI